MKLNLSKRMMLLVTGLVVVVCLGLGVTSLKLSNYYIMQQTDDALQNAARSGTIMVEKTLEKELGILGELANRTEVQTMDWEIQRENLTQDVKKLDYLDIGIMLPNGTARNVLSNEEVEVGDRDYQQSALKGNPSISDVLISRTDNIPVVIYAVPIRSNNQVVGVLFGRKDAAVFSEITDNLGYGENGYAYIIGSEGVLYAHPDREKVMNQDNILEDFDDSLGYADVGRALNELGIGNDGVINYKISGQNSHMGVTTVESTGWILAAGAYEEDILGWLTSLGRLMIGIALIFLIIGGGAAFFIGKSISTPIVALSTIIDGFSNFDLTHNVKTTASKKYLNRSDEIGIIANALERMHVNLVNLVRLVNEKAQHLAASSEELTATSEQSSTASEEVARAIDEMAKGASDQATETEKGATNVVDLGDKIVENQDRLNTINNATDKIISLKNDGLKIIEDLVEKTRVSGNATIQVQDNIIHTKESAEKIQNASQMIDSIAEQTNLLALNAAIEAARAGEAGRGFAVVAEEIRKLAEESNRFTGEISQIVQELSDKTDASVKNIENVADIAKEQANSVDITNDKFIGIANAIEEMKKSMIDFNQSMSEMVNNKDETLQVIENLSAIAQENAAGAQEASASMEEQAAGIAEISGASEDLSKLAEQMLKMIEQFRY